MKKIISLILSLCLVLSTILSSGAAIAAVASEEDWLDAPKNPATDYAYSFCLVGDTQTIVLNDVKTGKNQLSYIYDWIVENVDDKKIEHVFGLGDITDTYDDDGDEWEHAKTEIDKLNGVVSYSLLRGNHDNLGHFKNYFGGESDYLAQMDGVMTEGSPNNAYKTLKIGKIDYLILTLDYAPSDEVVKWASEIIEAYADYRVIVTTHGFLNAKGLLYAEDGTSPGKGESFVDSGEDNYGLRLWNKLIKKHKNIELVLCGHASTDNVVMRQEKGEHGNLVTEILVNPQAFDKQNGYDTGMVAMLYFSEDGNDVQVEYYSTCKQKYFKEINQFSLSTAEKVFKTWELNGTDTVSFEAPVSGKFTLRGAGEAFVNETALSDTELFDMEKGDLLTINANGEIEALLELNDEYPDKITQNMTATETIVIADALQVENTSSAKPSASGLITAGYVSGVKTGADMVAGAKNAVLKDGYTFYTGKYSEAGYGMSAFPTGYALMGYERQGTVKIESKNGSTQGIIITADKAGIYTLSSSTILKSGTGYVTVKVELPDGKIPYSFRTRHSHSMGFNVTAELEVGEKMFVYVCRDGDNYNSSATYLHDLTLKREVEGEFEVDDPDYEALYETHSTENSVWVTERKSTCQVLGTEVLKCEHCFEVVERRTKTEYADHDFEAAVWETTRLSTFDEAGEEARCCQTYGCDHNETNPLELGVVSEVVIKTEPEKLSYEVDEEIDITGLTVEVSYSNYEHVTLVEDFEGVEFNYSTAIAGKKVVSFNLAGRSLSFEIVVMGDGVMLGDSDGDGEITTADANAVLRFIAGYDEEINLADSDINGDGSVDVGDAVLILQYVAGYKVKELN